MMGVFGIGCRDKWRRPAPGQVAGGSVGRSDHTKLLRVPLHLFGGEFTPLVLGEIRGQEVEEGEQEVARLGADRLVGVVLVVALDDLREPCQRVERGHPVSYHETASTHAHGVGVGEMLLTQIRTIARDIDTVLHTEPYIEMEESRVVAVHCLVFLSPYGFGRVLDYRGR